MRPDKSKRVEVNPTQQGLAGLGNAFAGLNLSLPDAPTTPTAAPVASKPVDPPARKPLGRVILRRETAHRGGKTVIIVHDFPSSINQPQLEALAKRLRHAVGTGGTVKDRTIEMQGDQPGKIRAFLEKEGFQVAGVS